MFASRGWGWGEICIPNISAHNLYPYTICQLVVDRKITVFPMIAKQTSNLKNNDYDGCICMNVVKKAISLV